MALFTAQKNTEIPISGGARHTAFRDRQISHQFSDSLGDPSGFPCIPAIQGIVTGVGVEKAKFGFISHSDRIRCRWNQRLPIPIGDIGGLLGHQLAKQKIHAVRHLGPASEIMPQGDCRRIVFSGKIRPGIPFPEKKLRHGLTKAVYTLFDIAD